jgi:hypothetical protein
MARPSAAAIEILSIVASLLIVGAKPIVSTGGLAKFYLQAG